MAQYREAIRVSLLGRRPSYQFHATLDAVVTTPAPRPVSPWPTVVLVAAWPGRRQHRPFGAFLERDLGCGLGKRPRGLGHRVFELTQGALLVGTEADVRLIPVQAPA